MFELPNGLEVTMERPGITTYLILTNEQVIVVGHQTIGIENPVKPLTHAS